jgi:predicted membrane protein
MDINVKKVHQNSMLYLGILFIAVGLLLIASNVGWIPAGIHKVLLSWPMLLVVVGCCMSFRNGGWLVPVGLFFLIRQFGKVYPEYCPWCTDFVSNFWPVLLIIVGILLLFGRTWANKWGKHCQVRCREEISGEFSKKVVFGRGEYTVIETEFTGGKLEAVFSGIELDLRKAILPESDIYIDTNAVFSGIILQLPQNLIVDVIVDTTLGGINDNRKYTGNVDTSKRLIITGSITLSGIEIRN